MMQLNPINAMGQNVLLPLPSKAKDVRDPWLDQILLCSVSNSGQPDALPFVSFGKQSFPLQMKHPLFFTLSSLDFLHLLVLQQHNREAARTMRLAFVHNNRRTLHLP